MVEFWVFRVQSHFKMPSLGWNSMQTTFRKIRQKQPWFIIPSPYNWLDGSFMKNYICSSAWNNPTVGKVEHRTKNFIDKTGRLNERVPSRLPNRSYFYAHNGQTIAAICPFHRFGFVYDNHKIRSKWKSARYFFSRSLRFNFFDKQVKSRRKQIKQLNCAMEQRNWTDGNPTRTNDHNVKIVQMFVTIWIQREHNEKSRNKKNENATERRKGLKTHSVDGIFIVKITSVFIFYLFIYLGSCCCYTLTSIQSHNKWQKWARCSVRFT